MPMSTYLHKLREMIGPTRLLMPSVSAHVFDVEGRLLLVRQRDMGMWSTPGGMIEPGERPADAVVREVWEETELRVTPERVSAVYGGPEFEVRYPNGDLAQYVIIAFACAVTGGALGSDLDETIEARFWTLAETAELPVADWLRPLLPEIFAGAEGTATAFHPARWSPPPHL